MSAVRERDVTREWDRESVHSGGGPRTFTTVRRYKVPDSMLRGDDYDREEEMRIVRRETVPVSDRDRGEVTRRYYERDVEVDSPGRDIDYRIVKAEVDRDSRGRQVREFRFEREYSRSPSPEVIKDYRYERDVVERAPRPSPYSLEKYSKSTEYFSRPEPAQPIIIRNEVASPQPIIIQESAKPQQIVVRREEPSYEIIERTEVVDDKQVVKHAPREEDDYYYERRTREVDRGRRDFHEDEREYRRSRYEDANYHSDDDVVYVRKETTDGWARDRSPHHKRHLAEGVIAGVGAAELIRHHRKRQGEDPGHRGRQIIGYGALGAVGAEALSRAGTLIKSKSRSRSWSRDGRRKHRHRHHSRSLSRGKTLAGIGAVAAIGALAYAAGKSGKNQTTVIEERPARSRSRSRRRRHSRDSYSSSDRSRSRSRHMDPQHRNKRIAEAGLATAALAGIAEHKRNKSREKRGERSRSRIRTGVPIVASGLAGAAVTGLYEKARAKKEARSLSRSRSRSRSRSVHSNHSRRHSTASDGALVEYGGDPIYTDDNARGHRYRSHSRGRRSRSRSASKDRKRSRSKHLAEAAAIAGAAGLAAHEVTKIRDKKKAETEDRRRAEEHLSNTSTEYEQSPGGGRYYPDTMEFAPPPQNNYTDPNPAYNAPPGFDPSQPAVNTYPHNTNYNPPPQQPGFNQGYGSPIPPGIQQQSYNPADFGPGGPNVGANAGYYQQQPNAPGPYAAGPGVARGHKPEDMV